jgi:hypothetical protein
MSSRAADGRLLPAGGREDTMKKTKMLLALAVLTVALATPPVFAQKTPPAGTKDAMAALEKMISAIGGRKMLESIQDLTITGMAEMLRFGITVPVTIYEKRPDKVRVDMTIVEANMTISQAFDGRQGRFTDPQAGGVVEDMPAFMAEEFARRAGANQALLSPGSRGVTYALKPKAVLEGQDYIVLEQTLADGHKTTYFLDPETYLPYKTATRTFDQNGAEVEAETFSTNYQKVGGGLMVPYALRVVENGDEAQRVTVTTVTVNAELDDALFTLK